jgi:galactose-1-phosphate uridylyltransferase
MITIFPLRSHQLELKELLEITPQNNAYSKRKFLHPNKYNALYFNKNSENFHENEVLKSFFASL